ncbi:MAG: beta-hydroxyacyl-ACP dehydratase [Acidobacteria bacterium]|nr:MAG: beta-hydroxyacyl-ACP dehydratase [Acidobacteriota bacterium]RPJ76345.1 MAG: beta-hydroxyacyl-ACP dehydratase [Acidobacteriota bacterium]
MQLTPAQVLELLPQQRPFRFVDEILEVDETRITGRYTFRQDESFYEGHFPGRPITPGVILLESMCQVGVVALGIYLFALEHTIEEARSWTTLFVEAQTEFFRTVAPGATVTIRGERELWRRYKLRARIEMFAADGTLVAQATASGLGVRNA